MLRAAIYSIVDERKRFRQLVVNSVMTTDIMDKELLRHFVTAAGRRPSLTMHVAEKSPRWMLWIAKPPV
jgi:hypothetical protein